jgi:SPP1 gp7 family putative phage head morphogenesis protein
MAERPSIIGLKFREAIAFFRAKLRLGTRHWTDLWEAAHGRAFVVAGAMQDELLQDFQEAVAKALEEGTTLEEFRRDFDRIVATRGWSYRGSRGWRSRVIFDTNLRTAYQAGRWQQMQETKRRRPYLRYAGILDSRIRPMHRAWHGTILPMDHPWWQTHYPPNGWNCRCTVMSLSERDLRREGWTVSAEPPPGGVERRSVRTPEGRITVEVPEGIDPGFAYNVGESGWAAGMRGRGSNRSSWRGSCSGEGSCGRWRRRRSACRCPCSRHASSCTRSGRRPIRSCTKRARPRRRGRLRRRPRNRMRKSSRSVNRPNRRGSAPGAPRPTSRASA